MSDVLKCMRGYPGGRRSLLLIGSLGERVPARHPTRAVKALANEALGGMSEVFEGMYAAVGRPSIPPERLLKAPLLIALFSIRSDPQLCEQLEYNLMFRWFLDMELDEPAFDPSSFSQSRERLIRYRVGEEFLAAVVKAARSRHLLSTEHFSVDGTLIEAWASMKSFRPKDGPTATRGATSVASGGATTPMPRRPIPRRGWRARAKGGRPSWRTAATC